MKFKPVSSGIYFTVIILLLIASCEKENDFRSEWIGNYNCIELHTYFDPIDDTIMNWTTDTVSENVVLQVQLLMDSSITVKSGKYNITDATFAMENNKGAFFYGSREIVKFTPDKISVSVRHGPLNSNTYYGTKTQ